MNQETNQMIVCSCDQGFKHENVLSLRGKIIVVLSGYCCSLSKGGAPPKFLIIDDGWQQIGNENKDNNCVVQEGAQ